MYLHEDTALFSEAVHKTSEETGHNLEIVEKDYYVSMMLRGFAESDIGFIFKGGTSLSKAYKVLDRFSEDIDMTVTEKPTQGQRYNMADTVMEVGRTLGLTLQNGEDVRRRRDFNRYIFEYDSVVSSAFVKPLIIVEVYVALLAFPTTTRTIDSFVGQTVAKYNSNVAEEFGLLPFAMPVQDIRRTFIDKVFALCDYYLAGKSERYSRHIYDIYQILQQIKIESIDKELVSDVRQVRRGIKKCESAKEGANPTKLLQEIIDKDFFRQDYDEITKALLFTYVPYKTAISALEDIVKSGIFTTPE